MYERKTHERKLIIYFRVFLCHLFSWKRISTIIRQTQPFISHIIFGLADRCGILFTSFLLFFLHFFSFFGKEKEEKIRNWLVTSLIIWQTNVCPDNGKRLGHGCPTRRTK
jgi:hypothetical protein